MLSIVPKPQMPALRPGEMLSALPLTVHRSVGAQAASSVLQPRWVRMGESFQLIHQRMSALIPCTYL